MLPVFPNRCSVKNNPGVPILPLSSPKWGVFNCSRGPGPGLVGLICLREADKYQKGCSEPETTPGRPFQVGEGTLSFHSIRHW